MLLGQSEEVQVELDRGAVEVAQMSVRDKTVGYAEEAHPAEDVSHAAPPNKNGRSHGGILSVAEFELKE